MDNITAFVWDILNPCPMVDLAVEFMSLVFVLSAIPPDKQPIAISNIDTVLKPGGVLFFRDYAHGDGAEKRFGSNSKLGERWFVRQDGTLSYFFIEGLFE